MRVLTPEEAKAKVLDHWHQLDALARRRFPKDQNLAHEGLLYVLKYLEEEDWRRVQSQTPAPTSTGRTSTPWRRASCTSWAGA